MRDRLKVVFLPDFSVKSAQRIYPAADLSEQISTAGMEASGTGNMKFSLNGALTIGTLDGANIEIREEVGAENFFLFGMTADEVVAAAGPRATGPGTIYERDPELRAVLDLIGSRARSRAATASCSSPLVSTLLERDEYFLLADYRSYVECQERVARAYVDTAALDADVASERGPHGEVLVRPRDPRVLPRHLARGAGSR